jgi:hypothetical protein
MIQLFCAVKQIIQQNDIHLKKILFIEYWRWKWKWFNPLFN